MSVNGRSANCNVCCARYACIHTGSHRAIVDRPQTFAPKPPQVATGLGVRQNVGECHRAVRTAPTAANTTDAMGQTAACSLGPHAALAPIATPIGLSRLVAK